MSMKGIYLHDLRKLEAVRNVYDKILFGHYGCTQSVTEAEIKKVIAIGSDYKISLQYISPKVNEQAMTMEYQKVYTMLSCGQDVSINDWGLLYALRDQEYSGKIFLGRLLSKSLIDWIWSATILEKEPPSVKEYFSQTNMADANKEELLKRSHISGIELNVDPKSTKSYQHLKNSGFLLVGYTGYKIASCSRVCPMLRLNNSPFQETCKRYCRSMYDIVPEVNELFPRMKLHGNVFLAENNNTADCELFSLIVDYG